MSQRFFSEFLPGLHSEVFLRCWSWDISQSFFFWIHPGHLPHTFTFSLLYFFRSGFWDFCRGYCWYLSRSSSVFSSRAFPRLFHVIVHRIPCSDPPPEIFFTDFLGITCKYYQISSRNSHQKLPRDSGCSLWDFYDSRPRSSCRDFSSECLIYPISYRIAEEIQVKCEEKLIAEISRETSEKIILRKTGTSQKKVVGVIPGGNIKEKVGIANK